MSIIFLRIACFFSVAICLLQFLRKLYNLWNTKTVGFCWNLAISVNLYKGIIIVIKLPWLRSIRVVIPLFSIWFAYKKLVTLNIFHSSLFKCWNLIIFLNHYFYHMKLLWRHLNFHLHKMFQHLNLLKTIYRM